jgi:hypothetical protein
MPSREHPFAGDHVSVAGRLTMFSRREVRRLVERLGGSFSADISPRTTVVVRAPESEMPDSTQARVLSESDLCTIAGLPDLETLRSHYYAVKDLRVMYPRPPGRPPAVLGKMGADSVRRRALFLRRPHAAETRGL